MTNGYKWDTNGQFFFHDLEALVDQYKAWGVREDEGQGSEGRGLRDLRPAGCLGYQHLSHSFHSFHPRLPIPKGWWLFVENPTKMEDDN